MVIGVTGGIGSGKSLVSSELARLGAHVIDVDHVARELVEPGEPALEEVIREFGAGFRRDDGTLDRRALGRLVFSDREALARLNRIMFPKLRHVVSGRIERESRRFDLVVVDAAVLYEAELDRLVDRVILVVAPKETRAARIMTRNRFSYAEALARIEAQTEVEEHARRADIVICNSGTPGELLERLTSALHEQGIYAAGESCGKRE